LYYSIANLVNEAAILAARDNQEMVNMTNFERASERILAGLETKRTLSTIERKTVAYHEAGHAIVGWFLKYCSPVVKITIIPRSKGALGFTQYIPDENSLMTKEQIIDSICMTLGGRMAEEHFFKKVYHYLYSNIHILDYNRRCR
jgi:AFG3 family protein